jgi:hypothetical protein
MIEAVDFDDAYGVIRSRDHGAIRNTNVQGGRVTGSSSPKWRPPSLAARHRRSLLRVRQDASRMLNM